MKRAITRSTMLGLCLVAAAAMAAVAATSASAMAGPEWGVCYAQAGGLYANANCTEAAKKGTGTYEWRKGAEIIHKNFAGEGGASVLSGDYEICQPSEMVRKPHCNAGETEEAAPLSVECESEASHGEASGSNGVANELAVFRGCRAEGSLPCSNTGTEGEIQVNALKGALGSINKSKDEVGVLLEPVAKKSKIASFACSGLGIVVGVGNTKEGAAYSPEKTGGYDGIISPITPVNEMTGAFTQVYSVNANDENIPTNFEGKHIELLESYVFEGAKTSKWSKAGESLTSVNKPEVPMEISPGAKKSNASKLPKWWIGGKVFEGTEPYAEETTVTAPLKLELKFKKGESSGFTIECKKVNLKNAQIEGPSSRSEEAQVYEECEVVGQPGCSVRSTKPSEPNGTIATEPQTATLEGTPPNIKLKFAPKNSENRIAAYHLEGAGCSPGEEGNYEADGNMICGYGGVEAEEPEHPLEFTKTSGSKVKSNVPGAKTEFTVTFADHLASGKLYSAL